MGHLQRFLQSNFRGWQGFIWAKFFEGEQKEELDKWLPWLAKGVNVEGGCALSCVKRGELKHIFLSESQKAT